MRQKIPALQQLMTDIYGGLVDQIIVYKIASLTQSLPDFANLVDSAGQDISSVTTG